MNKKSNKHESFNNEKVSKMIGATSRYWLLAFCIFLILRSSNNIVTVKPSELSFVLKEYNPFFACLPVAFVIILLLKLIEFILICIKSGEIEPKDKSILSFLIKTFHLSYKSDQVILKNETILLIYQFTFCIIGFFLELKWFIIGTLGMGLYCCLYIILSFRDIKDLFLKTFC